jgi:hypothetical protein
LETVRESHAALHKEMLTCVDGESLAVTIDSQSTAGATLDWRRRQFDLTYRRARLERRLHLALARLMARLGLVFGAIDLAVTPDGKTVFFEVNSKGNWLWLERRLGLGIGRCSSTGQPGCWQCR